MQEEQEKEYVDEIEKILSIEPETIKLRVATIQEELDKVATGLRAELDNQVTDKTTDLEVMELPVFKTWMLCKLIIEQSQTSIGDDTCNRLLYYIYEEKNGSIPELLNQYDLVTATNPVTGDLSFELVVMETETYEKSGEC